MRDGPSRPPWRWRALLSAPHRLPFLAGVLLIGASALWWLVVLGAAALAWNWQPQVLGGAATHGLLMVFGFMPMFFAGFQLTAVPKWLGVRGAAAPMPAVTASWLAGWLVFGIGAYLSRPLAAAGMALAAVAWTVLCRRFVALLRSSERDERAHAQAMALADALGASVLWLGAAALAAGRFDIVRLATQLGLWAFAAPVFVAAAHRLLPYFSAGDFAALERSWPNALLWTLSALLYAHAALDIAEWHLAALPAAVRWGQALCEAAAAAMLGALALRWLWRPELRRRLAHRMPAMLFVGFVWFALAWALTALAHALMAAGGGALPLGQAPLHALSMGFMGSVLVAMVGRISAAHSGRAMAADDLLWRLFWLLQAAVLLRLLALPWPALRPLAALAWAAALLPWAMRLAGWFGRPRVDGRAG